jgi:hypothetical protein
MKGASRCLAMWLKSCTGVLIRVAARPETAARRELVPSNRVSVSSTTDQVKVKLGLLAGALHEADP